MITLALGSEAICWPSGEWRKLNAPERAEPDDPPTKSPSVRLAMSAEGLAYEQCNKFGTYIRRFIALNDSASFVLIQ